MVNFIIWLLDDMGRDQIRQYGVDPDGEEAEQPGLDALMARGVRFLNHYTQPFCSPERAALLAMRWGFQTGVLQLAEGGKQPLLETEVCLPAALKIAVPGYKCGAFGKWHLSTFSSNPDPTCPPTEGEREHPVRCGFDYFFGQLRNLGSAYDGTYYSWLSQEAQQGPQGIRSSSRMVNGYAPDVQVSRAVRWMQEQHAQGHPFLCYVPTNLPHGPLHRPPAEMYDTETYQLLTEVPADGASNATKRTYNKAMIQAQDFLLRRTMAALGPDILTETYIFWLTDNGTETEVCPPLINPGHVKRTVYAMGTRNPLIVAGPGVSGEGRTHGSIICAPDFGPTIIELAGGDITTVPLPPGGTRPGVSFAQKALIAPTPTGDRDFAWVDLTVSQPHLNCSIVGNRAMTINRTGETGLPGEAGGKRTWALLQIASTGVVVPANGSAVSSSWQFYNIDIDPDQKQNLIGDQPTAGVAPTNTIASPFVAAGVFTLTDTDPTFPNALTAYNNLKANWLTFTASY